ncbi:hypothetical protein ABIA85_006569 [Bradyrhizobium sp. LA6.10]|uniref:hypothetical protein n=1 Tax=Bradyrhizobium sp. LA6.10 TaxID=3156318 RepID=UPI0033984B80
MPKLTVSSHADAQILVMDAKLQVIHRGVGDISVDLNHGLYKVKVARGGGTVEQLLDIDSDVNIFLPVNEFPAIAPIGPMLGPDGNKVEALATAALTRTASGLGHQSVFSDRPDEPGLLIMGHHITEGAICAHPLAGLRVMPWRGDDRAYSIAEGDSTISLIGRERWGAIWLPYIPGCYLLEISDGAQTVRQTIPIAPKWQTRIFLRRRNWLSARSSSEGDAARHEWIDVSIQMSPPKNSVVYFDHYETIEVARNALQTTQPIFVSHNLIDNLLWGKYENPIAGITGLHLYLEAAGRSGSAQEDLAAGRELEVDLKDNPENVAREVIANLMKLLGESSDLTSDLVALRARAGLLPRETVTITKPPMFWVSWKYLCRHAGREGRIWVDPTLWNTIASSSLWGPYIVWEPRENSWQELLRRQISYRSAATADPAAPAMLGSRRRRGGKSSSLKLQFLDEEDAAASLGVPFSVTSAAFRERK